MNENCKCSEGLHDGKRIDCSCGCHKERDPRDDFEELEYEEENNE